MPKPMVDLDLPKHEIRILIVEADKSTAALYVKALRAGGYTVTADIVNCPRDFVSWLNAHVYDAVIADYLIPGWSGMDALRVLRQAAMNIPFLLVTHPLGDDEAISCIQQGVSSYVLKDQLLRLPQAVDSAICDQAWRVERLRSEETLRHSEMHYRELVENATFGICRATVPGCFLQVNASLVRMLGYDSKAELVGLSSFSVYRNPGDLNRVVEEFSLTGRVHGIEVEWKRKDDSRIIVCLSVRGVPDDAGELKGLEIFVEDVTERRALEKQLHHAQKFEAIGQLAGGIAHDFNNVIGAVMGWAELGSDQAPADSRLAGYFKKILGQAQWAAGLTRQLLSFARRQIADPQNIQLNAVVIDVMSLLEKVIGTNILIKTSLAVDLATVRADPSQIEQVLMNLCLNARDAMPAGGQLLIETRNRDLTSDTCRAAPGLSPGPHVELTVADNGTGIDAATREHIFEPFFTTKEPGKGTGLGLATVFGLIRQHGGFVSVESEPGKGATFRILLPAATEMAAPVGLRPKPVEKEIRGGTETILIADDHEGVREMLHSALGNLGYHVLQVADGEEAVRVFQERSHDIALAMLDIVMPKLGGCDAAERMRAIRPGLPVIFTTGYSADGAALARVIEWGGVVLQKPYHPRKLALRLRELLDRDVVHAAVSQPVESQGRQRKLLRP